MTDTDDTYPKPALGWTCFHCGDTFTTFGGARDHFGPTPAGVPGCIVKNGDEKGMLMALRKAEAQRDEAVAARELMEMQLEAARETERSVLRLVPGAHSKHDVWCFLDSTFGRARAAEAVIAEIEKVNPVLVNDARVVVCGPGTYYPMASAIPLPEPGPQPDSPILSAVSFVEELFEHWWDTSGQYCRSGGGQYERTFAFRSWEAALKQASEKLTDLLRQKLPAPLGHPDVTDQEADQAARACATLRWVSHVLQSIRPAVKVVEHVALDRAREDLLQLLAMFTSPRAAAAAETPSKPG